MLMLLSAAACGEVARNDATSPVISRLPSLSEGAEVSRTVSVRITTFHPSGKVKHVVKIPKRRFRGVMRNGVAIGRAVTQASPAPLRNGDASAGSSRLLAPPKSPLHSYNELGEEILIAVADGEMTTAYNHTFYDSVGVPWVNRTTSSAGGGPVLTSDLYRDGVVQSLTGYEWTRTTGGYVMTGQVAHLYDATGQLVAQIVEQTDPADFAVREESLWSRAGSRFASVGNDIWCALGPKPLFAQTRPSCFTEGLDAISTTLQLVGATAAYTLLVSNPVTAAPTAGLATAGWLGMWGSWTVSLIRVTVCHNKINTTPKASPPADQPRTQ